jgi:hypothetical protein
MMEMVNGSRFGVAMMGMGIARRCLLESAIWAHHREAKGRLLVDLPLVREQLVDLATEVEAALAFGFACSTAARLEDGTRLRRILVPAAKVRLCRLGVEAASATIELYGGNGYCEDWGLTRQLRDAQCHPIWEGSENICAIDVLRAIRRDSAHEAVFTLLDAIGQRAAALPSYATAAVEAVARGRRELDRRIDALAGLEPDAAEAKAGQLTELLVRTVSTALLLDQAVTDGDHRKALLAVRSARRHLDAGSRWDDGIAQSAGREILAFDQVDEATATQAAA